MAERLPRNAPKAEASHEVTSMKFPGMRRSRPDPAPPEPREEAPPVGVAQRAAGSFRRHVPLPSADELRRAAIDAPTVRENLLPAITGPQVADETLVLRVLDLALRVGEVQLATGAGAAVAHDTMLAIASAYGLPTCDVDIAFSTITMCCHRGLEAGPVTTMRNVRYRTQDYTRLTSVDALIKDIVDQDVPLTSSEAFERLATGRRGPAPLPALRRGARPLRVRELRRRAHRRWGGRRTGDLRAHRRRVGHGALARAGAAFRCSSSRCSARSW